MVRRDGRKSLATRLDKKNYSIADYFEEMCDKVPLRPALIYTGCEVVPESMVTFQQLDFRSNQVAHWAADHGFVAGDVCALYMENRIEYVVFWLGLCKAGVSIAFINNTIRKGPLVHSIAISNAKMVIYGTDSSDAIETVSGQLESQHGISCFASGLSTEFDDALGLYSTSRVDPCVRKGIHFGSVFGFVYTSGTTGLPKAVRVTHLKQWSFGAGYSFVGVTSRDVLYSSGMPLYHSSAGGIGTGFVLHYGCCQVIKKRFSASSWLEDVRNYKVTVVQYIGELCRYVNNQPRSADDRINNIWLATGNGLSKEIWFDFQTRFEINKIIEFYGSTEGNGAFKNTVLLENLKKGNLEGIGCIGKINPKQKPPTRFVKYDVDADCLLRNQDGKLIDCAFGEAGECLMPINSADPTSSFVGYTDSKASSKKLIRDSGIDYVRTGDMLSRNKKGWVKFVDRIGDTFRWRGENVSTNEVASELSKCEFVAEVNVYGVQVPHVEGRAGMAAVVFKDGVVSVEAQLAGLLKHAQSCLPTYAIPVFIRVQQTTRTTGTFKHQKVLLRNEGIDPNKVSDLLVWLDPVTKSNYVQFTIKEFQGLSSISKL